MESVKKLPETTKCLENKLQVVTVLYVQKLWKTRGVFSEEQKARAIQKRRNISGKGNEFGIGGSRVVAAHRWLKQP